MKRVGLLVAACLCLLAVSACGREPAAPMRVGADIWAGNEMLAVAEHAGRFDPRILRRVEFSNDQEILRALRSGTIEAGAMILDETLLAAADGTDLVIVAVVDSSVGSDAILAQPRLRSLADLKGRRIGIQFNSGSLQILRRALTAAQVPVADVAIVNVPPDRHVTTFAADQVDAVVTYDPMRTQLLSRGAVTLYDSSAISGDVLNVLAVRRDYLETHLDAGRALVDAWFAGSRVFRDSPPAREWVAHRLGLTPAQLDSAFKTIQLLDPADSEERLGGETPPLLETLRRFHGFMRDNGRLTAAVNVDRLLRVPPGWHQ